MTLASRGTLSFWHSISGGFSLKLPAPFSFLSVLKGHKFVLKANTYPFPFLPFI